MKNLKDIINEKLIINKDTSSRFDNLEQDIANYAAKFLSDKYSIKDSDYTVDVDESNNYKYVSIEFNETSISKYGTKTIINGNYSFDTVYDNLRDYINSVDNKKYYDLLYSSYCDHSAKKFTFVFKR